MNGAPIDPVTLAGIEGRVMARAGLTCHSLADVRRLVHHEAVLCNLDADAADKLRDSAMRGYVATHRNSVPDLVAAFRRAVEAVRPVMQAYVDAARRVAKALEPKPVPVADLLAAARTLDTDMRPPQRLDVGSVFADRLYDLARETTPAARHLSTARSLGVTEFAGLPVVVTDRVPADVCALVERDGTVRAVYTLDGEPARTR